LNINSFYLISYTLLPIYPSLNPSPRWEGLYTSEKLKAPLGGFGGKSQLIPQLEVENKCISF